jgi:16S rRNA (adenine1518-N6/adenine1519-N6)-dimethyltransferase
MREIEKGQSALPDGFVPNKSLGQNFLTRQSVIRDIVDAAGIDGQVVLEIGPGAGALTAELLERAAVLIAVEKDGRLTDVLEERFDGALTLVHADFLDANVTALTGGKPWHAVGNLPYYATTPIVLRLLSLLPESMTLMVQAEAAERFYANPSDRIYGPMAVLSQCFYETETVLNVPRDCFTPPPEVDSVVVHLKKTVKSGENAVAFLKFVKQAFSMRRKTLYNNLKKDSRLNDALTSLGYRTDVRAEAVPPQALFRLYQILK